MQRGITYDPGVALSGLIAVALLGVLFLGVGLIVDGLFSHSWIRTLFGAVYILVLSWLVWHAGQVIRRSLNEGAPNPP